ncbi:unnamed protein product [Schistosoma margrebowiei]|uniref:Uncharacterized protein n=1 Tax=Schistosoma margrebowiei TaxID=48269 RepID=A0AA85AIS3_9TREM|nr:unnamed protein product [Schistosoma margrebowiei]
MQILSTICPLVHDTFNVKSVFITSEKREPFLIIASTTNSMRLSWITISSICMVVIGLIHGHSRRFIF